MKHSVGEYVDRHIHTNGIESLWSMLKRAHKATFHKLSPRHLQRYVNEFAGRHNIREMDTIEQMAAVVEDMRRSVSATGISLPTTACHPGRGPRRQSIRVPASPL